MERNLEDPHEKKVKYISSVSIYFTAACSCVCRYTCTLTNLQPQLITKPLDWKVRRTGTIKSQDGVTPSFIQGQLAQTVLEEEDEEEEQIRQPLLFLWSTMVNYKEDLVCLCVCAYGGGGGSKVASRWLHQREP